MNIRSVIKELELALDRLESFGITLHLRSVPVVERVQPKRSTNLGQGTQDLLQLLQESNRPLTKKALARATGRPYRGICRMVCFLESAHLVKVDGEHVNIP